MSDCFVLAFAAVEVVVSLFVNRFPNRGTELFFIVALIGCFLCCFWLGGSLEQQAAILLFGVTAGFFFDKFGNKTGR